MRQALSARPALTVNNENEVIKLITRKEDIKTDLDLQIYGWDLRLIQIEEDIEKLKRRQREMMDIHQGLIEERDNLRGD